MSATLEEMLMAAEYVMAGENYNVVLCERGVRTFSDHSRNTLDLSVIPPVKTLSHLPIVVDPSHGTGKRAYVPPMPALLLASPSSFAIHACQSYSPAIKPDNFQKL